MPCQQRYNVMIDCYAARSTKQIVSKLPRVLPNRNDVISSSQFNIMGRVPLTIISPALDNDRDLNFAPMAQDLASGLACDSILIEQTRGGNAGGVAKTTEAERRVIIAVKKRVGRFVKHWQGMKEARTNAEGVGDCEGAKKLGTRLEGIAGRSHNDSELEAVLQRRTLELASSMKRSPSIGRELTRRSAEGNGPVEAFD